MKNQGQIALEAIQVMSDKTRKKTLKNRRRFI